ncbi:outer membrane protein assembly factor BamA [Elioraea thermophila]|uniref:outer membrane protein assembly factor BamA n=1 Tax=Elioraea thermophila TaxID=2185104 RepID=UPI000DF33F9C|nr:outer membrane protein assembly factor BamA [Elioraea thermophila]
MRFPFLLSLLAVLVLQLVAPTPGEAQGTAAAARAAGQGGIIRSVRVEGAQRIEEATIRSYMLAQPGDPFETDRLDRTLRALFGTGLFRDVSLRREGDTLVVTVVENPIVNRIAFEGNRALGDETLRNEIQARPRSVFTRSLIQADRQRLLDVYARRGRFAARIEPKVIELDQNRVDVVFEIDEGPTALIRRINFVGNQAFSSGTLQEAIASRETAWWRFLSTSDIYDPERLAFDRELLRRFYLRNGYIDFRVISAVAELDPDRTGFFLTFTVEEGNRYRVGKVELLSRVRNLDAETLRDALRVREGAWYAADDVDATIQAVQTAAQNAGFAFAEVRPQVRRNPEERTVDLTFEIVEGPRVFVERIDIVGNVRTQDKVIRREMRLAEGDAFSAARIARSRQRINDLQFFGGVNITNLPGSTPDRTVVQVEVQEKATGELTIGGGYSTDAGALGLIGLRERNLVGTGIDANVQLTIAQRRQAIDLSLTDPYFLDRNLVAGIDVFVVERNARETLAFDDRRVGFALRLGYAFNEELRQVWSYTLAQREITNISPFASIFIRDQEGKSLLSQVSQVLTFDRRNSRIDPTEGFVVRLLTDVSGLGGNVGFFRPRVDGAYYLPVSPVLGLRETYTLVFTASAGYLVQYGRRERIIDNFFLGGENLRGFEPGGAGPRDLRTTDSLGGRAIWTAGTEFRFPLPFVSDDLGLQGRAFIDTGALWDPGFSGANVADDRSVRVGAGVGVRWRSPFGVINVDLAQAIVKKDYDKTELFRFGFGTRF